MAMLSKLLHANRFTPEQELQGSARRNAFLAITVATVLVAVPLVTTGLALSRDTREAQQVRQITEAWAAETDYNVSSVHLSYTANVLDGDLPGRAEGCTLFIDPFGRPLTPISVAGMRRRTRRARADALRASSGQPWHTRQPSRRTRSGRTSAIRSKSPSTCRTPRP